MSVLRGSVVAVVGCLMGTLLTRRASADGAVTDGSIAVSMGEAWDELEEGDRALAAGDCVTMCKALHSMARAAQRICALSEGGGEAERQRCVEAKARVEEATKRVLAACPGCNPSPPYAPATAPPPPSIDEEDKAFAKEMTASAGSAESVRSERLRTPHFTVAIAPAALFLPPTLFKLALEAKLVDHLSLGVSGGIGRLATSGGDGHATVTTLGGQLRGYFFRAFEGLYLGADLRYVRPSLDEGEHLSSRSIVPGVTVGPMLGYKVIAFGGFTLDTSFGLGVVAVDRRSTGQSDDRVVPTWDLGLGYSF